MSAGAVTCGYVREDRPEWTPCILPKGHAFKDHVFRRDLEGGVCELYRQVEKEAVKQ